MSARVMIPAEIGDILHEALQQSHGSSLEIILIAIPWTGGELGQPTFCTSMHPDFMEAVICDIADAMPKIHEHRVIQGTYESEAP